MKADRMRGALAACGAVCAWLAAGWALAALAPQGTAARWAWQSLAALAQGAAALAAARAAGLSAAGCGLGRPGPGGLWPAAACAGLACLAGMTAPAAEYPVPGGGAAFWLALVRLGPAAALGEELAFRGAVQGLLAPLGGAGVAAQALLFAAAHSGGAGVPYALGWGLALGWLRRRTGSIWPGAALHCANNLAVFFLGR